ncbi:MAG TPA: glycosyltransferase [Acidimicrobiales bacterium]|jgi:glycosyltransferase involved in cell wall biosynthesis|nr:glycosyltransferase [Acidimicrobiales bacterium]
MGAPPRSSVSLVVPLRDEARTLPRLWASVLQQTLPPDEIVLVDGGSTDGTVALARQLAARDDRIRVIEAGPATPGRGRNVGIAAARHDWVALTDGGIALDPPWLEQLVSVVRREPGVGVVYGNYEPEVRTFFELCASLAYVGVPRDTPAGKVRGPTASSLLVHRSAWEAVGGFPDRRSAEDLIFFSRVEALGISTGWAPSAIARWELRPSLAQTYRRFALYSAEAVLAGRHRDWHHKVVRYYAFALPFVGLAAVRHGSWAAVPLGGAVARVARSIWRRREGRSLAWVVQPARFVGVAVVIVTIDMAMFAGWARAIVLRARGKVTTGSAAEPDAPGALGRPG